MKTRILAAVTSLTLFALASAALAAPPVRRPANHSHPVVHHAQANHKAHAQPAAHHAQAQKKSHTHPTTTTAAAKKGAAHHGTPVKTAANGHKHATTGVKAGKKGTVKNVKVNEFITTTTKIGFLNISPVVNVVQKDVRVVQASNRVTQNNGSGSGVSRTGFRSGVGQVGAGVPIGGGGLAANPANVAYVSLMQQGVAALQAGRYGVAANAFDRAQAFRPGDATAAEGRQVALDAAAAQAQGAAEEE